MVSHEEGVEFSALQRLRETGEMLEVKIRIRKRARITPRRGVDAYRPHESAQAQLTRAAHAFLLVVISMRFAINFIPRSLRALSTPRRCCDGETRPRVDVAGFYRVCRARSRGAPGSIRLRRVVDK